jgi:hypothetical protein
MFLGMSTYTLIHTLISLVMLFSGIVVVIGLLGSQRLNGWSALFLLSGVATSATGFGFPFSHLLPSHILGIMSLVVLVVAILARYAFHFGGAWRWTYAVGVVIALYFDVFVAIVQAFQKIPVLTPLAPTQSEPPFAIAQGIALVIFVVLAIVSAIKFHPLTASDLSH